MRRDLEDVGEYVFDIKGKGEKGVGGCYNSK